MSDDTFHKERQAGLGSTDSAAILGQSPWATAFTVYQEKTGQVPPRESSLPMWLGQELERTIATLFSAREGKRVRRSNVQHKHPIWPFIVCHVDYRVIGEPAVLELKTARSTDGWGEDGSTDIPVHYWIQLQHQLMVLGLPYGYVACLFGHYDFRTYAIRRDFDFTDKLAQALVEFWEGNVAAGVEPALDASPAAAQVLRSRYPADTEPALPATPEQAQLVAELLATRSQRMADEKAETALANQVKGIIGEHAGLIGPGWSITWKKSKPQISIDWAAVAERYLDQPDFQEHVLAASSQSEGSRRFIIKVEKEQSDGISEDTTTSPA
jgi:putative phage-type endonuclease